MGARGGWLRTRRRLPGGQRGVEPAGKQRHLGARGPRRRRSGPPTHGPPTRPPRHRVTGGRGVRVLAPTQDRGTHCRTLTQRNLAQDGKQKEGSAPGRQAGRGRAWPVFSCAGPRPPPWVPNSSKGPELCLCNPRGHSTCLALSLWVPPPRGTGCAGSSSAPTQVPSSSPRGRVTRPVSGTHRGGGGKVFVHAGVKTRKGGKFQEPSS